MAAVLAATGLFLYLSLRAELDHTIAQGLHSRAGDISALVQQADNGLRNAARPRAGEADDGFAQILDGSGRVFDATPGLQRRPLLNAADIRAVHGGPKSFERRAITGSSGAGRLLATPVHAQGRSLLVVVGASLEDRNQALATLGTRLLIGGPAALLLAAAAGYGLATAAFRPVESMRAQAAGISPDDLERRLPLAPGRDELHRLGETLNAMLSRLEAGQARERSFVADASHELRTPLAMLKTELELISRDRPEGDDLDRAVASAVAEADRLGGLTEDLLVLAQSDSDQVVIAPGSLQVADLLAAIGRRYPTVEVAAGNPANLHIRADRTRIEQALTNMVDNALCHGAAPIRVVALRRADLVEFHVTDAGLGFPSQFLPQAFERFARADASRSRRGTGLGLAIVRAIAQSHGGYAFAANRAGGGADVWIAIPAALATATERA